MKTSVKFYLVTDDVLNEVLLSLKSFGQCVQNAHLIDRLEELKPVSEVSDLPDFGEGNKILKVNFSKK